MTEQTKIVVADDHALVRDGLTLLLREADDLAVVGQAQDAFSLIRLVQKLKPDLVLLDLHLGPDNGITLCRRILQISNGCRVIILTGHHEDGETVRKAMATGASAFLLKTIAGADLLETIHTVIRGHTILDPALVFQAFQAAEGVSGTRLLRTRCPSRLSPREKEVFRLVVSGMTNRAIAKALFITERTVKFHVSNILKKLGYDSRLTALAQVIADSSESWTLADQELDEAAGIESNGSD